MIDLRAANGERKLGVGEPEINLTRLRNCLQNARIGCMMATAAHLRDVPHWNSIAIHRKPNA